MCKDFGRHVQVRRRIDHFVAEVYQQTKGGTANNNTPTDKKTKTTNTGRPTNTTKTHQQTAENKHVKQTFFFKKCCPLTRLSAYRRGGAAYTRNESTAQ